VDGEPRIFLCGHRSGPRHPAGPHRCQSPVTSPPVQLLHDTGRPDPQADLSTVHPTVADVYVDNYILAAVESPDGSTLNRVGRAALYTIHGLFPPQAQSGHVGGKDPISLKKLETGDAQ
jgi:hypothetical protein